MNKLGLIFLLFASIGFAADKSIINPKPGEDTVIKVVPSGGGTALDVLRASGSEGKPTFPVGLTTVDEAGHDVTIPSGETHYQPNLEIPSGVTYTVNGELRTVGVLTGAGLLTGTGEVNSLDAGDNGDSWNMSGSLGLGLATDDVAGGDRFVEAGKSLYQPNLEIPSGKTYTIDGTLYSVGLISGTGTISGSGDLVALDPGQNGDDVTFSGDVTIEGTLFGGSPIKLGDNLNYTGSGDFNLQVGGVTALTLESDLGVRASTFIGDDGGNGGFQTDNGAAKLITNGNEGRLLLNNSADSSDIIHQAGELKIREFSNPGNPISFWTGPSGTPFKRAQINTDGSTELSVPTNGVEGIGNITSDVGDGPDTGTAGGAWSLCTLSQASWQYLRVGNVVNISGRCDVNTGGSGGVGSCTWNNVPQKDANFGSNEFVGMMRINGGAGGNWNLACEGVVGTKNVLCSTGDSLPSIGAGGVCHWTYRVQ